jgi:CTP-dependent riboflavin kinase
MALNRDLFNFSAKVGCLEGYLHERGDADVSTLPNWVGNIERMYRNLPEDARREVLEDYRQILKRILQSSEKILKKDDEALTRLRAMIAGEALHSSGSSKRETQKIRIRGRIAGGLRVGSTFTQIPWVRRQFIQKLDIDPYPGTLNLEIVDPEHSQAFSELKSTPGVEIIPEDPSFCPAQCYPILIQGRLRGAIVLPRVKDYPENKMELIASQNIREVLSANEGDVLEVETF